MARALFRGMTHCYVAYRLFEVSAHDVSSDRPDLSLFGFSVFRPPGFSAFRLSGFSGHRNASMNNVPNKRLLVGTFGCAVLGTLCSTFCVPDTVLDVPDIIWNIRFR